MIDDLEGLHGAGSACTAERVRVELFRVSSGLPSGLLNERDGMIMAAPKGFEAEEVVFKCLLVDSGRGGCWARNLVPT